MAERRRSRSGARERGEARRDSRRIGRRRPGGPRADCWLRTSPSSPGTRPTATIERISASSRTQECSIRTRFPRCGRSSPTGSTTRGASSPDDSRSPREPERRAIHRRLPLRARRGGYVARRCTPRRASVRRGTAAVGRSRRVDLPEQPARVRGSTRSSRRPRPTTPYDHAPEALRASNEGDSSLLSRRRHSELRSSRRAGSSRPTRRSRARPRFSTGSGCESRPAFAIDGDHLEALVALGDIDRARALVERLADRLAVFERPWLARSGRPRSRAWWQGAARAARGRAEQRQRPPSRRCQTLPMPFERARTELVLGRLPRRERQRGEARASPRSGAFGLRVPARTALRSDGRATSLPASVSRAAGTELTEAESAVARAAASGLKNREIAEQPLHEPEDGRGASRAYLPQARDSLPRRARCAARRPAVERAEGRGIGKRPM